MIHAKEALARAKKLSEEELEAIENLDKEIGEFIEKNMAFNGCQFQTKEHRNTVMMAISQRMFAAGYTTDVFVVKHPHPLNKALEVIAGHMLSIRPSNEVYQEHFKSVLH